MKSYRLRPRCISKYSLLVGGAGVCVCALTGPGLAKQTIVSFDPPSSIATYAWSLNRHGEITGFYYDGSGGSTRSFVRAPDGTVTTFDHPTSEVTAAYGIDNKGHAAGYWSTDDGNFPGFV